MANRTKHRLHYPGTLGRDAVLTPDAGQGHYLTRVLRLGAGDRLCLFNAKDGEWLAEVIEADPTGCKLCVPEKVANYTRSPLRVSPGQVIARGNRADWAIGKATELGVNEVWPLFSERCQVHIAPQSIGGKQRRWQEIANESACRCLRTDPPKVRPPQTLGTFLTQDGCDAKIVMHESADDSARRISKLLNPVARQNPAGFSLALLVGPEGGFSEGEIESAAGLGFRPWQLGPRLFRTETAAPTALAVLQYLYGDLGEQ